MPFQFFNSATDGAPISRSPRLVSTSRCGCRPRCPVKLSSEEKPGASGLTFVRLLTTAHSAPRRRILI